MFSINLFRKMSSVALLILCSACVPQAVVQPSAQDLSQSQVANIAASEKFFGSYATYISKVIDANGTEVAIFEFPRNDNTVTVVPGQYEIEIDCSGAEPFLEVTVLHTLQRMLQAGNTYTFECFPEDGVLKVRDKAMPTK